MSINDSKNCTVLSRARVGNCLNIGYTCPTIEIKIGSEKFMMISFSNRPAAG
jgi:hypothetical protein